MYTCQAAISNSGTTKPDKESEHFGREASSCTISFLGNDLPQVRANELFIFMHNFLFFHIPSILLKCAEIRRRNCVLTTEVFLRCNMRFASKMCNSNAKHSAARRLLRPYRPLFTLLMGLNFSLSCKNSLCTVCIVQKRCNYNLKASIEMPGRILRLRYREDNQPTFYLSRLLLCEGI